eukprot:TRINITY_DN8241_c0_g2_i3.p1 TRINITY_DN8241_c0_g2~~TRINITY_DN8241_c0_g2_i3.p1  ORF type:complete len:343 (+),score=69.07 TRINITY_DN8241_c0_g2_i3:628-1656(+)
MWPLFTEEWGSWRAECLNLSPWPFTDPVTGLPLCHDWAKSPLLLYGFNKEIVECPDYWPSNVHICGFWFLPKEWQFSCAECGEISALFASDHLNGKDELCAIHADLECFLKASSSCLPIFIGLSSIPSMGFLHNPRAFLQVLKAALERTDCRFILFTAGYEPLDATIQAMINTSSDLDESRHFRSCTNGVFLFKDRLFCFSGTIPYNWIFPRCSVVIHHGGSGSTAAALHAGTPQIIVPFILDQFYWAEKMFWLGVAPEPLRKTHLLPDEEDVVRIAQAADALSNALKVALSSKIKERASEVSKKISSEDGVAEALKVLKEEVIFSSKPHNYIPSTREELHL